MQRGDDGAALIGESAEQAEHRELVVRIEMIGRLVQQENARLLGEQCGHGHPALLPAGEGVGAPRGEIPHVHRRERLARQALILGRLPLPQCQVWVAADQHRLQCGGDEGILQVLRQQPQPQRHGPALELQERRAIEQYLAAGGRAQPGQRVQGEGLARTVAAENRHHLAGSELHRQVTHQLARAGAHPQAHRGESRLSGALRRAVHGRVQRISSAVAGPTTTSRRPCGISKSCVDSARRPAMISARPCGYSGSRSGSAKPFG